MAKKDKEQAEQVEQVVEKKDQYFLDNGEPTSRAGYIRQEFMKNKSRKEIAEELGVRYNIVFSATANMFNEAHPEGGGARGGASVVAEHPDTGEKKPRREIMRELYTAGWTRNEIATHFKTAYGTVYSATKDLEAPEGSKSAGGGKVIIVHPETGEEVPRIDFIREKWAGGWSRRQIADAAGCDYSVVWMATREEKNEEGEEVPDLEEQS